MFYSFCPFEVRHGNSLMIIRVDTQPAITCSKLTIETLEQRCEICSTLTIKTTERRRWHRSNVSFLNFEQVNAGWERYSYAKLSSFKEMY